MNKKVIGIVVFLAMFILGCSNDQFEVNADNPPSQDLNDYLPYNELEFMGEGGYYHYYKFIETETLEDRHFVSISGEVKDNSKSSGKNDHGFQIELWIDSEKMVQTSSGQMLNESEFERLIVLKTPIVEAASWKFEAHDRLGEKQVVTGRIIEIDDENETIVIEYSTETGIFEKRTMKKKFGTTSFVKQVAYKDAVTFSGYHMNQIDAIQNTVLDEDMKYDGLQVVEINDELYELIDSFNKRWVSYIKNIDQSLMELIDVDSKAYTKVVAIRDESPVLNDYLGFKPFKMEIDEDSSLIYVMEKFVVSGDKTHYNSICYEIIKKNNSLYISDFYSTSF